MANTKNDKERITELTESLKDMVWQFAYRFTRKDGEEILTTGGLSSLEFAFEVLGYDDPQLIKNLR